MSEYTKRQRNEILRKELENERSSFISQWMDLGDYILPRRPRFTITDTNKGDRRWNRINDTTATMAARTLRSGMMSGITSPARPWFRLTTPDPELAEFGPVKSWLYVVGQRMQNAFVLSNLYNALPVVYGDLGVFGTGGMFIEEDFNRVIHCYPLPIGSYMIAVDYQGRVNVFFREFRMTVRQVVAKFGMKNGNGQPDWSNISSYVKNLWDRGHYEVWIDICHVVQPNDQHYSNSAHSKHKKFISCYYEKGSSSTTSLSYMSLESEKVLSEKGYDFFPFLCPRWEVTGEDSYGTDCPGMTALGDIKQLQLGEKRSAQGLDKTVQPPLLAPGIMRNKKVSQLPGGITYQDVREGQQGIKSLYDVRFPIAELEAKQQQIRERIRRAFYEDLFLMMADSDRRQVTAREIDERHEEKLLATGPVLEQLNQDLLDPLIDNTFEIQQRQGLLPDPPEELQGVNLKVEYISVMAQAQKLVGLGGIERFSGFAAEIMSIAPEVKDKVNFDQIIDDHAEITSIPPNIVRPEEEVRAIREERSREIQAQQAMEAMQQGAGVAKDLSQSNLNGNNALSEILKQPGQEQLAVL